MPFRRRPGEARDLRALLNTELRERIEEAVDHASLDTLVQRRRAQGRPAPAADSAHDREEFEEGVRALLERLGGELRPALTPEQAGRADEGVARAGEEPLARLVAVQVELAKALPDYWQQFERVRLAWTTERLGGRGGRPEFPTESRRERRGLLDRLFDR